MINLAFISKYIRQTILPKGGYTYIASGKQAVEKKEFIKNVSFVPGSYIAPPGCGASCEFAPTLGHTTDELLERLLSLEATGKFKVYR